MNHKMLKYVGVWFFVFALVAGAPKKVAQAAQGESEEHIAAIFVKDDDNGELRFLTGNNAAVNQFITQKQNLLEQLRPTNNGAGTLTTGTGTGALTTGTGNGVRPIVISLGNGGGANNNNNNNNGGLNSAILGASPIGDLLPQIVAQGVLGGNVQRRRVTRGGNRRRVVNRRGSANRRRPSRNGSVYVIRPSN